MVSWPATWISMTLDASGIPSTADTRAIMKAWKDSTPLPPYTNNPIGMPAGSSGAPQLLTSGYALFGSMDMFYAAFTAFIKSYQGKRLVTAMISSNPYPETWRVISTLKWPGSVTETDYPALLLDMTSDSYRESVSVSQGGSRKTSGVIGQEPPNKSAVIANARNLAQAGQSISDATELMRHLIRNGRENG